MLSSPFKKTLKSIMILVLSFELLLCSIATYASQTTELVNSLTPTWEAFKPILIHRLTQKSPKMRLNIEQVDSFVNFLNHLEMSTYNLNQLQKTMPKTSLELLMAVQDRYLPLSEAEKMASFLERFSYSRNFQNISAFDENTSHIIGREWHEIDYSGENMTWRKQKLKYQPYGILDFKSLATLKKFFVVESTLPYFNKTYHPQY